MTFSVERADPDVYRVLCDGTLHSLAMRTSNGRWVRSDLYGNRLGRQSWNTPKELAKSLEKEPPGDDC